MATLGINSTIDRSSACSILATGAIFAEHNKDCSFPEKILQRLQPTYDSWDCIATVPHAANEVRSRFKRGVEVVDYCEALSMATIASTDWDCCAVLLSDDIHTRLGYFANGSFYWIKTFEYPNSIALFYAAATRFLGYDAITEQDLTRQLSRRGTPMYEPWLLKHAVSISEGDYVLLHNLERGIGTAGAVANIACSAQATFSAVLTNLAIWLRKHIDSDKLAIVGRSASNYLTNTAIAETGAYKQIATISLSGAAATSLGAAAMFHRPLLEHAYVGIQKEPSISAEQMAEQLIQGNMVTHVSTPEFSDNSFINNNILAIPYTHNVAAFKHNITYAVCQDKDYAMYFNSKHTPYFGQYISAVKNKKALNLDEARVVCVSKNKNPFINRVLEITRAQGYPILVSTSIT